MSRLEYFNKVNELRWDEILHKLGLTIPVPKGSYMQSRYMKCMLHKPHRGKKSPLCLVGEVLHDPIWYCFSCHEGGTKFHFVSSILTRNLCAFKETARWFEKKFGIPSPYRGIKLINRHERWADFMRDNDQECW